MHQTDRILREFSIKDFLKDTNTFYEDPSQDYFYRTREMDISICRFLFKEELAPIETANFFRKKWRYESY